MADSITLRYSFVQPEVGASDDSWGAKLNANWASADSAIYNASQLNVSRNNVQVTISNDAGESAALVAATTSLAGVMTAADKSKLNGLQTPNLVAEYSTTAVEITNTAGLGAVILSATPFAAGVMSSADKNKLDFFDAALREIAVGLVNGATGAGFGGGFVLSGIRLSTGRYGIVFSQPLAFANYSVSVTPRNDAPRFAVVRSSNKDNLGFQINTYNASGALADSDFEFVVHFRP